jgi:hypothetical protein
MKRPVTPTDIRIRHATRADLIPLGRLGALLVKTHHDFDPKRFIAARGTGICLSPASNAADPTAFCIRQQNARKTLIPVA